MPAPVYRDCGRVWAPGTHTPLSGRHAIGSRCSGARARAAGTLYSSAAMTRYVLQRLVLLPSSSSSSRWRSSPSSREARNYKGPVATPRTRHLSPSLRPLTGSSDGNIPRSLSSRHTPPQIRPPCAILQEDISLHRRPSQRPFRAPARRRTQRTSARPLKKRLQLDGRVADACGTLHRCL